jgi:hypothetical protein
MLFVQVFFIRGDFFKDRFDHIAILEMPNHDKICAFVINYSHLKIVKNLTLPNFTPFYIHDD